MNNNQNVTEFRTAYTQVRSLVAVVAVSILIGVGIAVVKGKGIYFFTGLGISLGFGLSAHFFICLNLALFPNRRHWVNLAIGQAAGVVVGAYIALLVLSSVPAFNDINRWYLYLNLIMSGSVFGAIGCNMLYNRSRVSVMQAELVETQQQRLRHEKDLIESELRALQAQIEPHFLFNTLANIQALIDTDSVKAKEMLQNFTDLLRHSLTRSREGNTILHQEIEIVEKYLAIQKQRLGDRLNYHIECPDHLENLPFPPLLIQPVVENAVIHGIEPSVSGGKVEINVIESSGVVSIIISDNGRGLQETTQGNGIGMENTRNRLKAVFGEQGKMVVKENKPSGVIVELNLGTLDLNINLKSDGSSL